MMYPGGDPENGPARPSCGVSGCDRLREEGEDRYYWYSLPIDDAHEQALHEEAVTASYEDEYVDDGTCPYCGKEYETEKTERAPSSAESNLDEQADNSSNEDL